MPDQFVVPQFLDVEATIIGKITVRQFGVLMVVALLEFLIYRIFLNVLFMIGLGVPVLVIGILFSFARVNGQPFHYIVLNMVETLRRPTLRIWDKQLTDSDIKARLIKEEEPVVTILPVKEALSRSRLSEMSLVVNTGGVYKSEDVE